MVEGGFSFDVFQPKRSQWVRKVEVLLLYSIFAMRMWAAASENFGAKMRERRPSNSTRARESFPPDSPDEYTVSLVDETVVFDGLFYFAVEMVQQVFVCRKMRDRHTRVDLRLQKYSKFKIAFIASGKKEGKNVQAPFFPSCNAG